MEALRRLTRSEGERECVSVCLCVIASRLKSMAAGAICRAEKQPPIATFAESNLES